MIISCIAIDDEPLALSKLESFIGKIPELKLMRTFRTAIDALTYLREAKIDLIFLDIQMEDMTGIEFLQTAGFEANIIITTAYENYALKGFELNVTDYLLKPFSFSRFAQAVGKVLTIHSEKQKETGDLSENGGYIFVKTEYRLERVDFEEILYVEGMKDYLRIICSGRKIMTLQGFNKLEESLPSKDFCRVHKSYLVSLKKIKSVERGIIVIGDVRIPISNTYKDVFYSKIKL